MWYVCKHCEKSFFKNKCGHTYTFCSHKCHSANQRGKPTQRLDKIDRKGYWFIYKPDHPCANKQGYVSEQRLVVEKHIGRITNREEVVHHINHDKKDNRIENLKLFASNKDHIQYGHPDSIIRLAKLNKGKRHSPATEFKKGNYPTRWLKREKNSHSV